MLDWISDVWNMVMQIVQNVGLTMDNLVTKLDNVQFTEEFVVTKFLSLIHYVVGTGLYVMLATLITIGCYFLIWKLNRTVLNAIIGVIPGLKGKVKVL